MLSVRVTGREDLFRKLRAQGELIRREAAKAIAETALLIEADAKRLAPVDTGRLRASIEAVLTRVVTELYAEVRVNVSYAAFVELGTRYMAAQPFLIPAFEAHARALYDRLQAIYRG